jgi:hypothetical protein
MKIILSFFPDVYLPFSGYAQNDYPEPNSTSDYFIFNIVIIIIHTFMMQI